MNRFHKDSNQLIKAIETIFNKYDESLELSFTGFMLEDTMVFNEIKRSNYGKRSEAFNKILENEGQFCYIPIGNACFRNSLDNI